MPPEETTDVLRLSGDDFFVKPLYLYCAMEAAVMLCQRKVDKKIQRNYLPISAKISTISRQKERKDTS